MDARAARMRQRLLRRREKRQNEPQRQGKSPDAECCRRQAQAFVEGDHSQNPKRVAMLEPKFRQVIETGRANAVAVPESESQRVLATLKSIDPDWHRVLEAGGLVLMLPGNTEPRG